MADIVLSKKKQEVLNFIARWKRINISMLVIQFNDTNRAYWKQVLDDLLNLGLIKQTKSAMKSSGRPSSLYYLSKKGASITTLNYYPCLEKEATHLNKIGHDSEVHRVAKQVLKLEDDQFLTDYELQKLYNQNKKALKLKISPRFCDFAYYDTDHKLIGVEVELTMKAKERYYTSVWGPTWNDKDVEPDKRIAYISLKNEIIKVPNSIKTIKEAEQYLKSKGIKYSVKPRFYEKYKCQIYSWQRQGDTNLVKRYVHQETFIYAFSKEQAQKKLYKYIYKNNSRLSSWKSYLSYLKPAEDWMKPEYFLSIGLPKTKDCIWERMYLGIKHNFYKKVIWYLPRTIYNRFNNMVNEIYKNSSTGKAPDWLSIQCLEQVQDERMKEDMLIPILQEKFGWCSLNVYDLAEQLKTTPDITLRKAIIEGLKKSGQDISKLKEDE